MQVYAAAGPSCLRSLPEGCEGSLEMPRSARTQRGDSRVGVVGPHVPHAVAGCGLRRVGEQAAGVARVGVPPANDVLGDGIALSALNQRSGSVESASSGLGLGLAPVFETFDLLGVRRGRTAVDDTLVRWRGR